jgi:pyruvate/2-oxoglutarate/acetoin dehydrogenase E1 component
MSHALPPSQTSTRRMSTSSRTETEQIRYIDALNLGLVDALEEDERVVLIGIDVGGSGGVFTVTRGLRERFGPERIRDTPISEMAYVGAAVGAAMTGLRPIVEIMFMDFLGVCLDPIMNQAAKLGYMTNGALKVPIVFRTQTGAGRSSGAQHSQSLEAIIAHIPGLKVVMPGSVTDAHDLLLEAVRDPGPVVFIENRRLYAMHGQPNEQPLPLGAARIARHGDDVSVVTWGQTLRECLLAAETSAASLDVIDLRSLVPLDMETILRSVERTGRLLVAHEAVRDFGAGAEIAARVAEELFDQLLAPVRRLATPPVPLPFSPRLERSLLPSAELVAAAAEALKDEG